MTFAKRLTGWLQGLPTVLKSEEHCAPCTFSFTVSPLIYSVALYVTDR